MESTQSSTGIMYGLQTMRVMFTDYYRIFFKAKTASDCILSRANGNEWITQQINRIKHNNSLFQWNYCRAN